MTRGRNLRSPNCWCLSFYWRFRHSLQAMKITVSIAFIVISIACAIESQSGKNTRRIPKPKVEKRPCEGKKCTISATAPYSKRIPVVGGNEAIPHSWPWQAYIVCVRKERLQSICSGSLVSDSWIITAGHCFYKNGEKIDVLLHCKVLLGKHDLRIQNRTQQPRKIDNYNIHERYDYEASEINGNDLALLKLAKPVKFTDAIQPISLPFGRPDLPANVSCFTTGWLYTKHGNDEQSAKLTQLPMTVLNGGHCSTFVPPDRIFCATTWDLNKDVCDGDTGGPLACQEADQKWYLRGVLSYAREKCRSQAYFTKVAAFEERIKNIIAGR